MHWCLVVVWGCGVLGCGQAPGVDSPTCAPGDVECYAAHLEIEDGDTGQTLVLSEVDTVDLLDLAAASASTVGVTGTSGPMTYGLGAPPQPLTVDWTDPNGARPGPCFMTCNPARRCTARSRCIPIVRDGLTMGSTRLRLSYRITPGEATDTFDQRIIAVSSPPGGPDDPAQAVAAGTADVAQTPTWLPVAQTIVGTNGGNTCSAHSQCDSFAARECGGAGLARCGDGLCHCCEVRCVGACQCIACTEGCSTESSCLDEVCTFNAGGPP